VITLTPEQQTEFKQLVYHLAASNFACGDWNKQDNDEPYDALLKEAHDAQQALFQFVGIQ
jgi:hypothetical protein